jgi:hypothetical protein
MAKKIIFLVSLILFISCNNKKKITKISLQSCNGGKLSSYSKLEISKNQTYYVLGDSKSKKDYIEKTSNKLWKDLINNINIDDFLKVKSNPGRLEYDGTDVTILISYGDKSLSIVNGEADTLSYKKLKKFISIIEKQESDMFNLVISQKNKELN